LKIHAKIDQKQKIAPNGFLHTSHLPRILSQGKCEACHFLAGKKIKAASTWRIAAENKKECRLEIRNALFLVAFLT
jgi:hypothetical protein